MNTHSLRSWVLLASFLVAPALSGCGSATPTDPGDPDPIPVSVLVLTTDDLIYKESEVVIQVGGTVRWRSDSRFAHTITPDGHELWESVEAEGRGIEMLTVFFDEPGVYPYFCIYHGGSGMTGFISVQE